MSFQTKLDKQTIAELKGLVMDATRKANSGHPGGAMSSSDFSVILFREYLRFAPKYPKWQNRDRFVLSAGHESMLLYSLLHFMDLLSLDEIKNFRQLGSLTPGHPENFLTPGVEATTGPLGQGISMAVGMAIAEKHQRAKLGEDFCNHKTYVLVGDGDLQEPVAIGSCALAGHLALSNLVVYYDKNDIQISGKTSRVDSTDFVGLFESMAWDVVEIDGHNHAEIRAALDQAQKQTEKPLLIIGDTIIANGTFSMEGSHKTHGEPLKPNEIVATKNKIGLNPNEQFFVSAAVKTYFNEYLSNYNQEAKNFEALSKNQDYGFYFDDFIALNNYPEFDPNVKLATRKAFGKILEYWAKELPLMGGSADLEPSNNTTGFMELVEEFCKENPKGRNLAFGVREFPMTAICNGMALHGGILPFNATFLTFSDYSRNAIRMSAIQQLQVLHVFTHDSIFLGEDGPTHQPVEHVMSLRAIPDLLVMRPADAKETVACMQQFLLEKNRPTLLALTRQSLPTLGSEYHSSENAKKGAYIKFETKENQGLDLVIYASGSEVALAIDSAKALNNELDGNIRVVSIPCWKLFFEQDKAYQDKIMSHDAKYRVSIEAGTTLGWERFVGLKGKSIGVDKFGKSAPFADLANVFGFTVDKVCNSIRELF